MSKYNFQLDMTAQSHSATLILRMVTPGTRVLEFGPADGVMTRHMKENLNCEVFIVEYDEQSYRSAMKYAYGGYCGDIENYEWVDLIDEQSFDYILFSDVLEHLTNPQQALKTATRYLKYEGRILLSVPNIAHSAVIIDLIQNKFNYHQLGLLDNTHLRHFTYTSLRDSLANAGLVSTVELATYALPAQTEFANNYFQLPASMAKLLAAKEFGTVYQFVFGCVKTEYMLLHCDEITELRLIRDIRFTDTVKIYAEYDGNFDENNTIAKPLYLGGNEIIFDVSLFEAKRIRIDFGNYSCAVTVKNIIINGDPVSADGLQSNCNARIDNVFLFEHNDPYVLCEKSGAIITSVELNIEYEFIEYKHWFDLAANIIDAEHDACAAIRAELDSERGVHATTLESKYNMHVTALTNECNAHAATQAVLNAERDAHAATQVALNAERRAHADALAERDNIITERDVLQTELHTQSTITARTSEELEHYKTHYHAAINQREELKIQLVSAEQQFQIIANSTIWRMTKPLRAILDPIRRYIVSHRATHLLAKGVKSLLFNGFGPTWRRVKLYRQSRTHVRNQQVIQEHTLKEQRNTKFSKDIKFSVVTPLYNTSKTMLCEMIESVQAQTYSNWELCLADGSDEEHVFIVNICEKYAKKDSRIKYRKLEKNLGISGNTNAALAMVSGNYVGLLDHDDLLHPSALFEVAKAICDRDADFIYTDEDKTDEQNEKYFEPNFKPDFSIDYLRTINYICHFSVFKKSLLDQVGAFYSEYDGSQDHDMILRLTEKAKNIVHISKILYHWRAIANSTAVDPFAKTYTTKAGIKAVTAHLSRCGLSAIVENNTVRPYIYRITYAITGNPLISIIIPNKDHLPDLKKCMDSIIEKTTYSNYEIIIVENNSETSGIFDYYKTVETASKVKVLLFDEAFNFSRINNFAANSANGDYLLLLNNDIEVISPNWIEEMLMYAQRPDVGAVGAKLYYPDDTIQHAGVILGLGGVAGHSHKHYPRNHPGYMVRLVTTQNLSSVTGACMMIPKKVFDEVGGFDDRFKVAFNDVDICMRIRRAGYLIVFTPFAELYHYESKSRGFEDTPEKQQRFNGEKLLFQQLWSQELNVGDPYYSINLTLDREDFSAR
jgi:GT2 family glycosyltransferase/2-polyprenyl-3-methyl-5-hydroxy-6-metoxy-1,4-benzoquinol methylase